MPSTMPTNFRRYVLSYAKSKSIPELAESFQVTPRTIYNWAGKSGMGKLNRPRVNGVDKNRIRELLETGMGAKGICEIMKCSESSVKKVKRVMGKSGDLGADNFLPVFTPWRDRGEVLIPQTRLASNRGKN